MMSKKMWMLFGAVGAGLVGIYALGYISLDTLLLVLILAPCMIGCGMMGTMGSGKSCDDSQEPTGTPAGEEEEQSRE